MNKDLYIALLEDHVDDLTTAAKIDTVLSFQKTEKIRGLKSEPVSMNDWNKAQDELISKIADTAMDYQEELNDLKIKHTEETQELRASALKQLKTIKARESAANAGNVQLQIKIAGLNDDLETALTDIAQLQAKIAEMKEEKCDTDRELEKQKKENVDLRLEFFRLNPPAPSPIGSSIGGE